MSHKVKAKIVGQYIAINGDTITELDAGHGSLLWTDTYDSKYNVAPPVGTWIEVEENRTHGEASIPEDWAEEIAE